MAAIATAVANMIAQQAVAAAAIASVQPETAAPTRSLLAVATTVQQTIAQASALQALVAGNTDAVSSGVYLAATSLLSALQSYLSTLNSLTGADGATAKPYFGTDLFTIAATELGDWTRWTDIAAVNNLVDPYIATPTVLFIPPQRQNTPGTY
jgi:hypothetical protein